jgi:uncharacterized lipoprotein
VSGMKFAAGFICLASLVGVSGCHTLHNRFSSSRCSESQTYLGETSVAPLKVPVGLEAPDTTNALRLPNLKGPTPPPRPRNLPCLDEPPSFKVEVPKPAPQA